MYKSSVLREGSYHVMEPHNETASCEFDGDTVLCYCHKRVCNINHYEEYQEALMKRPLSNETLQNCMLSYLTSVVPVKKSNTSTPSPPHNV
ncbi:hypothetical protein DICVIV_07226 [Dictyocaulus viviparus]|uniref:Uncharacterized protein n=1 Tax=Dictyocaulus viviparus TaxID=29172 RepID=A0A0D8XSE4_DICVI|nr:hypothetical protein DICVIV_07226 [Dictyocaulus viviparus]